MNSGYCRSAGGVLIAGLAVALTAGQRARAGGYDPLAVSGQTDRVVDWSAAVGGSEGRDVPIRVYLPASATPQPVVLFSHGLGGSKEGSAYLGRHWAARGYVAVFTQHAGSDTSVWRGKPARDRLPAMQQAASGQNFLLRVQDIHSVLDQLERWNADKASPLAGRLDLSHVGMSGHSFGAVTTQAVSGQHFPMGDALCTDSRIKAAVMFSPSCPRQGDAGRAFGSVSIPWMLMTGTKDVSVIGGADVESRLKVFPALPPGNKFELVLFGAEHSAFSDRALPGDREARNPNHHRAILALSTAFWDGYLRDDAAARAWLKGNGPRSLLEPRDRWQMK
jgi:dienelactone hydrolase